MKLFGKSEENNNDLLKDVRFLTGKQSDFYYKKYAKTKIAIDNLTGAIDNYKKKRYYNTRWLNLVTMLLKEEQAKLSKLFRELEIITKKAISAFKIKRFWQALKGIKKMIRRSGIELDENDVKLAIREFVERHYNTHIKSITMRTAVRGDYDKGTAEEYVRYVWCELENKTKEN